MIVDRTQVAIVGAGPAGLLLGQLLYHHDVASVIVEARSREYCEARIRAGVIEQGARETLIEAGAGERMEREGLVHGGIYLRFDGESHHIPISELTGGRTVTIYGQTEALQQRGSSGPENESIRARVGRPFLDPDGSTHAASRHVTAASINRRPGRALARGRLRDL